MHMISGRYRKPKSRKKRKKSEGTKKSNEQSAREPKPTPAPRRPARQPAPAPQVALASTSKTPDPERRASKRKSETQEEELDSNDEEEQEESSFDEEMVFREPTATERKIGYFQDLLPLKQKSDSESDYVLVNRSVMENFVSSFKCPACESKNLKISFLDRHGFAFKMRCFCPDCDHEIFGDYTNARVQADSSTRPPFKVNRSITESFMSCGLGHAGLETFCENMGMPSMSSRAFQQHLCALSEDLEKFKVQILQEARQLVREAYELEDESLKLQEVINVGVTYDGSWQRRGFASLYGVGFVIDIKTGLVLDFCLLSKYCHSCVLAEKNYGADTDEFRKWEEDHKASGSCNKNYEGSSQAMEMAGAAVLWKRSIKETNMRYTVMLSDGDAKTFSHLEELQPYGEDIEIVKEECINHVSKRLVSGLKEVVSKARAQGITLGGVGQGQLTENVMHKLGSYYRKALNDNKDSVQEMERAALATLYHYASTNKKPQHKFCPDGPDSWCFWKKYRALKTKSPKTHDDMSIQLNPTVFKHILPLYNRLTEEQLLERCRRGGTQNTNESIHSVLWSKCPKEVFVSRRRLEMALALTAAELNMGRLASLHMKRRVSGEPVPGVSSSLAAAKDKRRAAGSVAAQQTGKFQRKKARKEKAAQERKNLQKEGVTYAAGGF